MEKYILVLDAGTTNIKAFLFNQEGQIISRVRKKTTYIIDEPGQVEQEPRQIRELSQAAVRELLAENNLQAEQIASLGITTQRASFLFWDKKSGEPLSNIITWQDKRAAAFAARISNLWWLRLLRFLAGILCRIIKSAKLVLISILKFDSVYASARTGYYLKTHPDLAEQVWQPDTAIAWGTIDSWLLWNLSGQKLHVTDYSCCASTGLMDPFTLKWNAIVLGLFKIPQQILPEIRETGGDFGTTSLFGNGEIPINAVFADQQASLFGQCCFERGDLKCTNGTGSFIDINTGSRAYASRRKLYPLVAWRFRGSTAYMLEGQSQNTGNIIDWLQHELQLIFSPEETEALALTTESTGGVFFLPAFTTGLTFPYWDASARGNIFGISLKTSKAQIIRAVLEGLCFRIKDIVDGIAADTKIPLQCIKLDGGVSHNKFILQFLADILGISVEHSLNPEATALGTAFMAGLACGYWQSIEVLKSVQQLEKVYQPQLDRQTRQAKYKAWQDIIRRSLHYSHEA